MSDHGREPIRVLHVTTTGTLGGAERLIADLASTTGDRTTMTVCTILPAGALREVLASSGVPCFDLGIRRVWQLPLAVLRLILAIRRGGYDIVHGHLVHGAAAAVLAATLARRGVPVLTRHYAYHVRWYGTPMHRALERAAFAGARRIYAISSAVRDVLISEGIAAERIQLIPNGIDADRVRASASRAPAPGDGSRSLVIGTVGSLHPRKGHVHLLHALAKVRERGIDARAVLIGSGPLESRLRTVADAIGIGRHVAFSGYQADPYPAMAGFDLYVQPSVEEGFGISVLEAMALGRPVIVTRVGGLPEIVEDGVSGRIVPPADPAALAEEIVRLAKAPGDRERLGRAGADRVERAFSIRKVGAAYLASYREILGWKE